ncbi:hypothetical protein [Methylobacterium oxalidis]|uniref:hypothetical protein n=1 Tax=Methylobacterium oxalidis TaxID=944322 RepID=UPI00331536E8
MNDQLQRYTVLRLNGAGDLIVLGEVQGEDDEAALLEASDLVRDSLDGSLLDRDDQVTVQRADGTPICDATEAEDFVR